MQFIISAVATLSVSYYNIISIMLTLQLSCDKPLDHKTHPSYLVIIISFCLEWLKNSLCYYNNVLHSWVNRHYDI